MSCQLHAGGRSGVPGCRRPRGRSRRAGGERARATVASPPAYRCGGCRSACVRPAAQRAALHPPRKPPWICRSSKRGREWRATAPHGRSMRAAARPAPAVVGAARRGGEHALAGRRRRQHPRVAGAEVGLVRGENASEREAHELSVADEKDEDTRVCSHRGRRSERCRTEFSSGSSSPRSALPRECTIADARPESRPECTCCRTAAAPS